MQARLDLAKAKVLRWHRPTLFRVSGSILPRATLRRVGAPHAVQDRSLGPDACIHAFALTPVLRD